MWSGGKQGEQVHAGAASTFFIQENNGSKPEAKQGKHYMQEIKQKNSTFSSFQHHRQFALKSNTPVPVKETPEDKASSNSRKQKKPCTKETVETVHPQPKEKEIHFPCVTISAAPQVQVDYFQFRAALMRADLQGQQGRTKRRRLQQRRRPLGFPL